MRAVIEDTGWKTCCRGNGSCPQVSLVVVKGTPIVFIKDDVGDSVRMTKEQFDIAVEQVNSLCDETVK